MCLRALKINLESQCPEEVPAAGKELVPANLSRVPGQDLRVMGLEQNRVEAAWVAARPDSVMD